MNKVVNTKIVTFIFLLVVVVLLIFLNKTGFLNQTKNYPVYLISHIGETFQLSSNKVNDFFWTLKNIARFKEENMELKKKNLEIEYEISELKEVQRENEILKKQIKFSESNCSNGNCIDWKMANIIGRDPSNFGKHILIDLGKNNGIIDGQPVVAGSGLLIGKIIKVFNNSSKAILITDGKSSINSITQTSRANGVVKGSYATGVRLEMINQSEELIINDLIITSGLEDKIPKGLIIGKISSIKESANKVFKSAEINMLININKVEKVFIAVEN
ncbi:MAG: rod shape-determining protein MreC [Patescibacteria group bacterium]|nr:rod shape-determining protein MreC [Patescibacteria group bacterium]